MKWAWTVEMQDEITTKLRAELKTRPPNHNDYRRVFFLLLFLLVLILVLFFLFLLFLLLSPPSFPPPALASSFLVITAGACVVRGEWGVSVISATSHRVSGSR